MTTLAIIAAAAAAALLLIWLGYPLAIWAAAKVVGDPLRPDPAVGPTRSVTAILATRDDAAAIRDRVANLLDTDHPEARLDVIVALDHEGAKATPQELHELGPRVRCIVGDSPGGKATALNAAVRVATGEILVMADAQQRFDRHTIPVLVAAMQDLRFGAVSGALTLGGERTSPVHRYWALEKWLRANEAMLHSSIGVTGAVYATRRDTWPVIPAGTLLDDVYVPMSLVMQGARVGFTYAARASDVRAFDAAAEGTRKTRTLTGVLQLRRLLPGLLSPRRNPVWGRFLAHKLLRLATPYLTAAFAFATTAFTVAAAYRSPWRVLPPCVAVVLGVALVPKLRRAATRTMRWGIALQLAALRAVGNGVQGRWSVWQRRP